MKAHLVIVEDDIVLCTLMCQNLTNRGYVTKSAASIAQLMQLLEHQEPDLVILDAKLPDGDGISKIGEVSQVCPVLVLTAHGSVQNAVQAIKAGATEYLLKPVSLDELHLVVDRVLETHRLRKDNWFLKAQAQHKVGPSMVGESPAMKTLRGMINAVAGSEMTVLITGESGVGKELVARAIHDASPRAEANFVAIDCCSFQDKLFESELFGHERGAFTGADRQKPGLIEMASGGTLFLDEIGEVEANIQAKLLRVLETGKFRRLGGTKELTANVRFVAATNRNLEELSFKGDFRSDLYFRLSGFSIEVPSLRDRRDDIPLLVAHLLGRHPMAKRQAKTIHPRAMRALVTYDWPGNIRELRNIIERAVILSGDSREIDAHHLSFGRSAHRHGYATSFDTDPSLEEIEKDYLNYLLQKHSGQRLKVAQVMGISERSIYRLIDKYEL